MPINITGKLLEAILPRSCLYSLILSKGKANILPNNCSGWALFDLRNGNSLRVVSIRVSSSPVNPTIDMSCSCFSTRMSLHKTSNQLHEYSIHTG